jgi:hypothetical protein
MGRGELLKNGRSTGCCKAAKRLLANSIEWNAIDAKVEGRRKLTERTVKEL